MIGLPGWLSDRESACQFMRCGFDPWLGRSPGEEKATHFNILAWGISWSEEPGRPQSMGVTKSQTWLGSSVQFSCSVVSNSVTHGLQHSRPPVHQPTPRAYSNSCPLDQWCHPTISSSVILFSSRLQSFPAWVFSNESALCIRWPKYWSFSFNISPSDEHPGLIPFRMDWLDLLAVQGTLKNLLQHQSSKASILLCSAFFIVQLSHPYVTPGKTIALTRWIFVGKIMSLLFNILSRLVIAFLPKSKCLLISWLQSPSAVILEPPKIKPLTLSIVSPWLSN